MRKCISARRISILRPWNHRSLRTPQQIVSRQPAVKQLSNAELLKIVQDKEDTIFTAVAQSNSNVLDSREDDILPQTASFLASDIPRIPQSPLTDSRLIAARSCHKAVKPLPFGDRSLFQLKLQKNSYGILALICSKKQKAKKACSHCISDSTSIMRLNRPSTAKLLPDSLRCRHTPKNWGTMASSKNLNPSGCQCRRRRESQ